MTPSTSPWDGIDYRINIGFDCPAEVDEYDGLPLLLEFRIGITAVTMNGPGGSPTYRSVGKGPASA